MTEITREGAGAPQKDASAELREELWSQKGQAKLEAMPAARRSDNAPLVDLKISSANPSDSIEKRSARQRDEPAEANSFLKLAADQTVNQAIYQLPKWARLPKPAPGLGCVSSFSNRYREALRLAGVLDTVNDDRFRNYYQVNMDELNKVMGRDSLLKPIADKDLKEGDVIQGLTPDTSKRHMGIVGPIENGQRMVYDNYGGIWRKEPLDLRFGEYKERHFYRAFLPVK